MKICEVCDLCFDGSETTCHGELKETAHSFESVPGYRIERAVRIFARTSIFQARDLQYGQECRLTIFDGAKDDFLADASQTTGLFHANVANVIEGGELPCGSAYAIAESFDGDSLRDVLAKRSLSLLDQIVIARQTAEGVHAIHAAGLLHGAIRPENISVSGLDAGEPVVKLHQLDLGSSIGDEVLASRFSMDTALDLIRYFAPERFHGEQDAASDVYSLGLVLYELLSGHPPFQAESAAALIDQHLNERPPEIKIENFDLRMLLTHTLSESLQKKPSFRQATADLFARQMRHIEQLATHVPTPPPAVIVSPKKAQVQPRPVPKVTRVRVAPASDPMPIRAPEPTVEPTIEIAARSAEKALPYIPSTPKRSRLKGMKRRLQSHLAENRNAVEVTPTLIEWSQPEGDIPSVETTLKESSAPLPIVSPDADEEITHVRPHVDRIEVTWSQPNDVRSAAEFVPSLLTNHQPSDDEPHLLGYGTGRFDLGKLPIYGVVLCGFLVVAFGVIKLGTALADDSEGYIGEVRPAPIVVAAPARYEPITAQPAVINVPAQSLEIPASIVADIPASEPNDRNDKVIETTKPGPARRSDPLTKPETAAIKQESKSENPIVPSTLVITRGGQRPKSVVVAESDKRETRPVKPGSGTTRPRVVSLPD